MHLIAVGGSDAGISAALRARELDPSVEVTVVVADGYPDFSYMTGTSIPNLLFICAKNGGRSQMAAAWARSYGGDAVIVTSAGAAPGASLNAEVVSVLSEHGLDLAAEYPKAVTPEMVRQADVVVALKPGLEIPLVEGARYEVWDLPDPDGEGLDGVRETCEQIRVRIRDLLDGLGIETPQ